MNHKNKDCYMNDSPYSCAIGVNALISATMFVSHSLAGMLSKKGRCATFDASADGYVRAEGDICLFWGGGGFLTNIPRCCCVASFQAS
jgi:hypothetical protein